MNIIAWNAKQRSSQHNIQCVGLILCTRKKLAAAAAAAAGWNSGGSPLATET